MGLVTSATSLLAVLVVPHRANTPSLAARYEALLTGILTPDVRQFAAALATNCAAFLTNDRRLPTLPALPIIQLANYAP